MSTTNGPDPEDIAAGVARLEAALDRIESLADAGARPVSAVLSDPVPTEVLQRLDSMIDRLRAALDEA